MGKTRPSAGGSKRNDDGDKPKKPRSRRSKADEDQETLLEDDDYDSNGNGNGNGNWSWGYDDTTSASATQGTDFLSHTESVQQQSSYYAYHQPSIAQTEPESVQQQISYYAHHQPSIAQTEAESVQQQSNVSQQRQPRPRIEYDEQGPYFTDTNTYLTEDEAARYEGLIGTAQNPFQDNAEQEATYGSIDETLSPQRSHRHRNSHSHRHSHSHRSEKSHRR
ncbi:hypothetical protein GGR57DRAFT_510654 [Xylariaceae sp. FL1272]|nr:hypothetical protein GGR57DRAFT_510654 [Xylariaceae sp. FL1272]